MFHWRDAQFVTAGMGNGGEWPLRSGGRAGEGGAEDGPLRDEQLCSRLALAFVVGGSEGGREPRRPSRAPLRRLTRAVRPHQQLAIPIEPPHPRDEQSKGRKQPRWQRGFTTQELHVPLPTPHQELSALSAILDSPQFVM